MNTKFQDAINRIVPFLLQNANPSIIYHVKNDILAHTKSWRTKENIGILSDAYNKLLADKKLDYTPGYCVNFAHLVGCCGAFDEGMDLGTTVKGTRYINMNYVEYMSRCGLYHLVPKLKQEVDVILNSIDDQGICRANYLENGLKGMGTYSGGQLEEDWKSKTRKLCDVTYRALLILFYLGNTEEAKSSHSASQNKRRFNLCSLRARILLRKTKGKGDLDELGTMDRLLSGKCRLR